MSLDRPDEEKWLEWRRGGITATEVADAANGTYGGAYGVVARKLGIITVEQNSAMQRGHRWQPKIADAVHALTELVVVGEETWCESSNDPRWRATVDGFLAPFDDVVSPDDLSGVIEVKTRGVGVRPNRERWADQMQWQMLVTGMPVGLLADAVIDDTDDTCVSVHLSELKADPVRQSLLISYAENMWGHFQAGTLQEPSDPSALDDVKAVHPGIDPDAETVDLSDLEQNVARFVAIKAAVKSVTDEQKLLEAQIREAIGDAGRGECNGYRVTVSKPRQVMTAELEAQLLVARPDLGVVVLDKDRAKNEAKDVYEAHRAAVGARTITVRELS